MRNTGDPREAGGEPDAPRDEKSAMPPTPSKPPVGYTADGPYRTQEEIAASQRAGDAFMRERVAATGPELRKSAERHAATEKAMAGIGLPKDGVGRADDRMMPKDPPGTSYAERNLAASGKLPPRPGGADATIPPREAAAPAGAAGDKTADWRLQPKDAPGESPADRITAARLRDLGRNASPARPYGDRPPTPVRGAGRPVGGGPPRTAQTQPAHAR